jgi:hypothetical protein
MKTLNFHSILLVLTLSTSLIAQQQESWTTFTTAQGLADNRVITICQASDSTLWFGTDGAGVSHYADGSWTSFTIAEGLVNNIVNSICETRDKALWFGTYNGISRYQNGIWTTINTMVGLIDNRVNVIYEAADGALWIGTYGGVACYQKISWSWFTTADGLVSNRINAITQSIDGAIWFGTNNGINRYKEGSWDTLTTANGLADNTVFSIYETDDGALWFGTRAGVCQFYNKSWKIFTKTEGLADNWVYAIHEAYDKALWFATRAGVSRYKNNDWKSYSEADGLANDYVKAIALSNDGALWFGTFGGGVSRFQNDASWLHITYPDTAGISWSIGKTFMIKWDWKGNDIPLVKIELIKDVAAINAINLATANNGSYPWQIPLNIDIDSGYRIRISSTDDPSIYDFSDRPFAISSSSSVADNQPIQFGNKLFPNYPNPFNSATTIRYQTSKTGLVQISIYNILGKKISSLVNSIQSADHHEVWWNGKDDTNKIVSNGIYILEMKTDDFIERRKITLLK